MENLPTSNQTRLQSLGTINEEKVETTPGFKAEVLKLAENGEGGKGRITMAAD